MKITSNMTLTEEAIRFPQFYRNLGVRKLEQLSSPRFHSISAVELPLSSTLHYLPLTSTDRTIDPNNPFLVNHAGPSYGIHVIELAHHDGAPTRNTFQINAAVQQVYKSNRKLRRVRDASVVEKDPRSLLVYNYSFLQHMYRYRVNYLNPIQRWNNTWYTAWKQIAEAAASSERNQFITIQAPKTLPSIAEFKLATAGMNRDRIQIFQAPGNFELLELWRWAGGHASALDAIKASDAERVNIIVQDGDTVGVLNLGNLIEWRKIAMDEDLISDAEATGEKLSVLRKRAKHAQPQSAVGGGPAPKKNEIFQRKLLMFFVRMVQNRMDTPGEDVSLTVDPVPKVQDDLEDDIVEQQDDTDIDEIEIPELDDSELMDDSIFEINAVDEPTTPVKPRPVLVDVTATPEAGIVQMSQTLQETGHISTAEGRRFKALSERYQTLASPWGEGTVGDLLKQSTDVQKVDRERSRVKDIPAVLDKTMLESSMLTLHQDYIEKVLPSHMAKTFMAVQRAGIAVTDIRKETVVDALNRYDVYSIKMIPIDGQECTLRFPMQQVQPDGTWTAAGVKYRLRMQRRDCPIHKTKPDEVALSSYEGKLFIRRSRRAVHNFDSWLHGAVILNANSETPTITELKYRSKTGGALNPQQAYPRILSCLAARFGSFTVGECAFDFNIAKWDELYGAERVTEWLADGFFPIGKKGNTTLLVDMQDAIYVDRSTGPEYLGDPSDLLGVDFNKAPLEITELKLMRKNIPLGLILAYYYGLSTLVEMLGCTPRRVPTGTRAGVGPDEFSLRFFDETWVLPRNDRKVSMLLGGLVGFARETAQFEVAAFDSQDVYLPILMGHGLNIRWLRRLDDLRLFFVDPMTAELLVEMKEPTTFDGLLMRSNEMLVDDRVIPQPDLFKGYERFAGTAYREIIGAVKRHRARPAGMRSKLDFKPDTIWKAIAEDPSVSLIEESNPLHHLKEQEAITYSGTGGRSSRSMVRTTRQYGSQDLGIVSEATVDSGDVAINTFTSSNPVFDTVTGVRQPLTTDLPLTSILSTSSNMAVGAMNDDAKRVLFIGIQNSSSVAAEGYHPMPYITGYDYMLPHRCGDLFAFSTKEPGVVTEVSAKHLSVTYASGQRVAVELGRRFGVVAGKNIPHQVVTDAKVGQRFEKNAVLAWNSDFFVRDRFYPDQVRYKAGILVRYGIVDTMETFEDSSAITTKTSKLMSTKLTKKKTFILKADQKISHLVREGTNVAADDVIAVIEDPITAQTDLFSETTADLLKEKGARTQLATVDGVVEQIEVLYRCDLEDMSESIREVVTRADRQRAKLAKQLGRGDAPTGQIIDRVRVNGRPLELNNIAVTVYITYTLPMVAGDKHVAGHQLKSVPGRVIEGDLKTESGVELGGFFAHMSIFNRIVMSVYKLGTTNALIDAGSREVARIYFEE